MQAPDRWAANCRLPLSTYMLLPQNAWPKTPQTPVVGAESEYPGPQSKLKVVQKLTSRVSFQSLYRHSIDTYTKYYAILFVSFRKFITRALLFFFKYAAIAYSICRGMVWMKCLEKMPVIFFLLLSLTFLTLDIILLQGYSTLIAFSESDLMNTF